MMVVAGFYDRARHVLQPVRPAYGTTGRAECSYDAIDIQIRDFSGIVCFFRSEGRHVVRDGKPKVFSCSPRLESSTCAFEVLVVIAVAYNNNTHMAFKTSNKAVGLFPAFLGYGAHGTQCLVTEVRAQIHPVEDGQYAR